MVVESANKYERLGRDEAFMAIAHIFARRSTCLRGQVGCVAVQGKHLVAAGYNGAPPGMPHCLDVGCGGGVLVHEAQLDSLPGGEMPREWERQDHYEFPDGCTRAVHAELNLVAFCAKQGISLDGCTIYSTAGPCLACAKALISAGMATLHYETPYRLPQGLELVDAANVRIVQYVN